MKALPFLLFVILAKRVVARPPPITVQNYMNQAEAYKNSLPGGTSVKLPNPPAGTANMIIHPPPLQPVSTTLPTTTTTTPKPTTTAIPPSPTATTCLPIETTLTPTTSTSRELSDETTAPDTSDIPNATSSRIDSEISELIFLLSDKTTSNEIINQRIQQLSNELMGLPKTTDLGTSFVDARKELISRLTTQLEKQQNDDSRELTKKLIEQLETLQTVPDVNSGVNKVPTDDRTTDPDSSEKPTITTREEDMKELIALLSDETTSSEILESRIQHLSSQVIASPNENLGTSDETMKELITQLQDQLPKQTNDSTREATKKLIEQLEKQMTQPNIDSGLTAAPPNDQTTVPNITEEPTPTSSNGQTADITTVNNTDIDGTSNNESGNLIDSGSTVSENTGEDGNKSSANEDSNTITTTGEKSTDANNDTLESFEDVGDADGNTIRTEGDGSRISTAGDKSSIENTSSSGENSLGEGRTVIDGSRISTAGDKSSIENTSSSGENSLGEGRTVIDGSRISTAGDKSSIGNTSSSGENSLGEGSTVIADVNATLREDSTTSTGTTTTTTTIPIIAAESSQTEGVAQAKKPLSGLANALSGIFSLFSRNSRVKPDRWQRQALNQAI